MSDISKSVEPNAETPAADRVLPTTVSDFLLSKGVSAKAFLKHRQTVGEIGDEDLAKSEALLNSDVTLLPKFVELVRAVLDFGHRDKKLLRWCEEIVRNKSGLPSSWNQEANQSTESTFLELAESTLPLVGGNRDKIVRTTAENMLVAGTMLLMQRRALSPESVLRVISALEKRRIEKSGPSTIGKLLSRKMARSGIKQLIDYSHVALLMEREILVAEEGRRAASGLSTRLQSELEHKSEQNTKLKIEMANLHDQIDQMKVEITNIRAQFDGSKSHARQDIHLLKARFRREIGDHLAGLISDAWDALDTVPSHPEVALERIEMAREVLRKEIEWLDQS